MKVELKVNKHPSGRYTLTEKTESENMPHDCKGDLLGNLDAGSFYRAVANKLYELSRSGDLVVYIDTTE
ncbi:MAG: hypothetical protein G8D89_20915 [gamma proteobacterium symbiont of Clathrolucina costata]